MFKLNIELERLHEDAAHGDLGPVQSTLRPVLVSAPVAAAASGVEDLPVIGAQPCLSCGSRNVHRSKARNLYERFKKLHTATRLVPVPRLPLERAGCCRSNMRPLLDPMASQILAT